MGVGSRVCGVMRNDQKPGDLVKSIEPIFNRAVIFDTTQNSWHGLPIPLTCPDGESRETYCCLLLM